MLLVLKILTKTLKGFVTLGDVIGDSKVARNHNFNSTTMTQSDNTVSLDKFRF